MGRRRGRSIVVVSDNRINIESSVALNKGREYFEDPSIKYFTPRLARGINSNIRKYKETSPIQLSKLRLDADVICEAL
jgi:hypothetical protein